MTKFEIKSDNFEFRFTGHMPSQSAQEIFDQYLSGSANDPVLEASFDTLEEAKAEFAKNYANYGRTRLERNGKIGFLRGDLAWIEENEYDEDGEFDQNCGVWEISAEPFSADDDGMTYQKVLEMNESAAGLDLKELSLENLLALIDEVPGWDYPLAEDFVAELANRAGIDMTQYFAESDRDYSDLWATAAEKLGVDL